jgi:glycosyltransferase involved in cell wall biosynthesis
MESLGISIIICCYNSSSRIERTLEYIRNQKIDNSIDFEVIIVNNASSDDTELVCRKYLEKSKLDFSIVNEPNPGLSNARIAGVSAAKYEYLLFCDDDNFLCDTYLKQGYEILNKQQNIIILGGYGMPIFEDNEPSWFSKYALNFACGPVNKALEDSSINFVNETYGAGMFIRKLFFNDLKKILFSSLLTGRRGNSLMSGEDSEYFIIANALGYKIAVDVRLRFGHLMPKSRMTLTYLRKLHFGFGRTRIYTQAYEKVFSDKPNISMQLRLPLWKDKLLHKKRELRGYLPFIWFKSLNDKNLDRILKYEALRGEIQELSSIKNRYSDTLEELKELKFRIEHYKNA